MNALLRKLSVLVAVVLPLTVNGVPVGFHAADGTRTDGYVIRHSGGIPTVGGDSIKDLSTSWWTMFTREDGAAFDASCFTGGSLWDKIPFGVTPAILVQGLTTDGHEFSQIVHLTEGSEEVGGLLTFNLDESFENLLWVKFSSLDLNPGFALDCVDLNPTNTVPESGPGLLVMVLVLAAMAGVALKLGKAPERALARIKARRK